MYLIIVKRTYGTYRYLIADESKAQRKFVRFGKEPLCEQVTLTKYPGMERMERILAGKGAI